MVSSLLDFDAFSRETQNNKANPDGDFWTAKYSKWCLADGRQVASSRYELITSSNTIPDLRGLFLRGINSGRNDGWQDPDGERHPGTPPQTNSFKQHSHGFDYREPGGSGSSGQSGNSQGLVSVHSTTGQADTGGGTETRPKNAAVFYYIRIN